MTVHYTTLSWPQLQAAAAADSIVIVPVGATEQHGHHLPLQVDWRLVSTVAEAAAEQAVAAGGRVLVTPAIWTGYSPHHMQFSGSITLSLTTFLALVGDVVRSLHHHGFRRIVLLNGHGGNANLLRSLVQDLRFQHGIRAAAASYWDFATADIQQWRRSSAGGINHACEMETSLMLAVMPQFVDMAQARDATFASGSRYLSPDLAVGGAVTVARTFAELTADGVIGNPAAADAERGRELLNIMTTRVAEFLREFAAWPWDDPNDSDVRLERTAQ
jgi:creatinine amidohydrolase